MGKAASHGGQTCAKGARERVRLGIPAFPVDLSLLSALNELSLIRPRFELLVIRNGLVSASLILLGAVFAALKITIALDFSENEKRNGAKHLWSVLCPHGVNAVERTKRVETYLRRQAMQARWMR